MKNVSNNEAKAKLRKLAETAVIHDVVSPTGDHWSVMNRQAQIRKYRGKLKWEGDLDDMRRD